MCGQMIRSNIVGGDHDTGEVVIKWPLRKIVFSFIFFIYM